MSGSKTWPGSQETRLRKFLPLAKWTSSLEPRSGAQALVHGQRFLFLLLFAWPPKPTRLKDNARQRHEEEKVGTYLSITEIFSHTAQNKFLYLLFLLSVWAVM